MSAIPHVLSTIKLFGMYRGESVDDLITALKLYDSHYHNTGIVQISDDTEIPDALYDEIYEYARSIDPNNEYFVGVGAPIVAARGGKIDLPVTMGSLNERYEDGSGKPTVEQWVSDNGLVDELFVVTDKLDGTAGLLGYSPNNSFNIGYSRGDGTKGADISRHIVQMPSVPKRIRFGEGYVIGENIISEANFVDILLETSDRKDQYKTPRNAVSGIMNGTSNPRIIYQYVDFVAYGIISLTPYSKNDMLTALVGSGFKVAHSITVPGSQLTTAFLLEYMKQRQAASEYRLDGVVIDINCPIKRAALNANNSDLNPKFAVKFKGKSADAKVLAVVEYVQWNVSKHRYFKPRIVIAPVEIGGVTVRACSGYNAKFIMDNGIGPGTELYISRNGDVIPNVAGGSTAPEIILATGAVPPSVPFKWNDTEVDFIADDDSGDVICDQKQLVDFFTKLEVPGLKRANVEALYVSGLNTVVSIITSPLSELQRILGPIIGEKIYKGLHAALSSVKPDILMGAYSTTRGIGIRKIGAAYDMFGMRLITEQQTPQTLATVPGYDTITIQKVLEELDAFSKFLQHIDGYYTFNESVEEVVEGAMHNEYVVVTGFRNKTLDMFVKSTGGEMQSAVNKKTTILVTADGVSPTVKIAKARENGVRILTLSEFNQVYGTSL